MRKFLFGMNRKLRIPHENDFYVEMLVDENNKNEPAAVIQRCRDKSNKYDKKKLLQIIAKMSDKELEKFCYDTRRLQQFADTYHGFCGMNIREEIFTIINHPLANDDEVHCEQTDDQSKKNLSALEDRVRKFVEIQPGYSNQKIHTYLEAGSEGGLHVFYGEGFVSALSGSGRSVNEAFRNFVSSWNLLRGEEYIKENLKRSPLYGLELRNQNDITP